jgi:hypothetical protein
MEKAGRKMKSKNSKISLMGLLKKAAGGVLAIFPCSRTGSTFCA